MQQTLEELTNRAQTVNYKRIDLSKVEMELYLLERGYHNGEDTYLSTILVLLDKENESVHSYIRPHGKYYEGLVERGHEIINTVPNNAPALPIENETELKTVCSRTCFYIILRFVINELQHRQLYRHIKNEIYL